MTDEQNVAVGELRAAMEGFVAALARCHQAGLRPEQSMAAIGVQVPRWANPVMHIVERKLEEVLAS